MPGTAGKKVRVRVATTVGGTYVTIAKIKSASFSIDGANLDDSEFGVDWVQRIQGLKDSKLTLSGQRDLADTLGQNAIQSALLNDTTVFFRFLPDGGVTASVGYQQEMKVAKFSSDGSVDGIVSLSIELEGSGAITLA